jgi:chromosomal replication initiation ATPase DnaA
MTQLPLPLAYAQSSGEADFFISDCNSKAVMWIDHFPDWGHHATILLGPEGSGKSHLAAIFKARHSMLVDVVDQPIGHGDELWLFHLFNAAKEASRGLLIIHQEFPANVALPDLASRLAATPVVRIEAPDDAVLGAVMIKAARDRGLNLPPDVISYALPRLERRFAAVHNFVAQLDSASLAERRAITVPLASKLLAAGHNSSTFLA